MSLPVTDDWLVVKNLPGSTVLQRVGGKPGRKSTTVTIYGSFYHKWLIWTSWQSQGQECSQFNVPVYKQLVSEFWILISLKQIFWPLKKKQQPLSSGVRFSSHHDLILKIYQLLSSYWDFYKTSLVNRENKEWNMMKFVFQSRYFQYVQSCDCVKNTLKPKGRESSMTFNLSRMNQSGWSRGEGWCQRWSRAAQKHVWDLEKITDRFFLFCSGPDSNIYGTFVHSLLWLL